MGGRGFDTVLHAAWRQAQQEVGERGQPCSRVGHRAARVSAIQGKAVLSRVIDHVSAIRKVCLPRIQVRVSPYVTKVLVQRAERVSSTVVKRGNVPLKFTAGCPNVESAKGPVTAP